ncbi:MAG: hypothetical protein AAFP26_09840 [Planctomycetota bacterium]
MLKNLCAVGAIVALAGGASAQTRIWEWNQGDTNSSNNGGIIDRVYTTYNANTEILTWEVDFADQVAEGFTLALNDGPNPKGDAGELALLYFDATNMADVNISVYGYNGQNNQSSYIDGSPAGGQQQADRISTNVLGLESAFIAASAVDNGAGRTFSFTLDASAINAHSPLHPGSEPWGGIGFGELIGYWFHPVKNLTTAYDMQTGYLTDWSGQQGWLDGANKITTPTPAAAGLLGLGGLAASRRRRA